MQTESGEQIYARMHDGLGETSSLLSEEPDLIATESTWRADVRADLERIAVARWQSAAGTPTEFVSETPVACHIVGIALRNMNARFVVDGRTACDGPLAAGSCHVSRPGETTRCTFRGGYDVLHLFVPNRLVESCAMEVLRGADADWALAPVQDETVAHLARSLVLSGEESCRELRDHIAMAIVTRLLLSTRARRQRHVADGGGLPRWRLKRAFDYIDTNIAEPLTLAEIAAAAGLSRMHFAAQFRKSTGQRPHEYLLNRRVERAQAMLVETELPIAQIALAVGFQAQSHFTTIFRRIVGQPPHAWRCEHAELRGLPRRPVRAVGGSCPKSWQLASTVRP